MFKKFLTLALIAAASNAVFLQEEDCDHDGVCPDCDQEEDLDLDIGECSLDGSCASWAEVAEVAQPLACPDVTVEVPEGSDVAGESIIDEMVSDFEFRQQLRALNKEERKARRAERERILGLNQPDPTTQ